jgi:GTPase SAR1 family protein
MFKALKSGIRLRDLKRRLQRENPILTEVVDSFQAVDQIGRRLGFLSKEESFAASTSWWPLISVLGLYSSGKSSFINHYLQFKLQATGNQAVDDKFTVICFTNEKKERVLPGVALDADPRFPLYKISQAIEAVAKGEGHRVDAYLQLKTCPSEKLRGKILVDSPGFDADAQRTSTLQITDHIIDLSDLVLVFFDARHPETGSMQDTLQHMVSQTINRSDSNKFLYILNQIDMTAAENNTEEVFAAWQRALAQYGLTAGCCYAIYVPEVATHIENPEVRSRLESKRDMYLRFIYDRIEQVGVERAYRIAGILESTTRMLKQEVVPRVQQFIFSWRRLVLWADAIILGALLAVFLIITIYGGFWNGLSFRLPFLEKLPGGAYGGIVLTGLAVGIAGYIHFRIRRWAAKRVIKRIIADINDPDLHSNYIRTFEKNSRWYSTLFRRQPAGWGQRSSLGLEKILEDSNLYIQKLNDMYTNPSGDDSSHPIIVPEYSEKTSAVDLQDSREVDVIREEASKNTTMH